MDDNELLRQFIRDHSQAAFKELVSRHVDWVFSVCQRRLGDAALAEDATQAVFLALLQKSTSLLNQPSLGPWLHRASQYAAAGIHRDRRRRARREREVATMNSKFDSSSSQALWHAIETLVEPALDRLGTTDREVIMLRFYQRKSHAEIASLMQISEEAAQKRLGRALQRLREILGSGCDFGEALSVSGLSALLADHAVGPAPAGIAQAAAALSKLGATMKTTATTKAILQGLIMNKLKAYVAAGVGLSAVIASAWLSLPMILSARAATPPAGPAMPVALSASAPAAADSVLLTYSSTATDLVALPFPRVKPLVPATPRLPVEIANSLVFKEQATTKEGFLIHLDGQMTRLASGTPAGHIKISPPLSDTAETARSFAVPVETFRGKRIRLSGWFKSKDVANFGRLRLGVWGNDKRLLAEGSTAYTDPIHGTTDWREYQIVADVPENSASIMCTVSLAGPGELWADGLQVDVVPATVATTDDQQWHLYTSLRAHYDAQLDPAVQREGRPTMRIFTDQASMPAEAFAIYARIDRHPEKYVGKTLRFTMWIKFQDVTGTVGPAVRAWGSDQTIIARFNGDRPRGTADWRPYTINAKIPQNADFVDFILALNRAGKAWVDVDHVEYEVIDEKKIDLP